MLEFLDNLRSLNTFYLQVIALYSARNCMMGRDRGEYRDDFGCLLSFVSLTDLYSQG